jgi:hypothetical protein
MPVVAASADDGAALRRLVSSGWICRQSDGSLCAHPQLLRMPRAYRLDRDRPWTASDDADLRQHAAAGASLGAVADSCWRTRTGVVARLIHLRQALTHPQSAAACIAACRTWAEAAVVLGLSRVHARRYGLRLGVIPDPRAPRTPPRTAPAVGPLVRRVEPLDAPSVTAKSPVVANLQACGRLIRQGDLVLDADGSVAVSERLVRSAFVRSAHLSRPATVIQAVVRDPAATQARNQQICALAQGGSSPTAIARAVGMSRWGVTLVLRQRGIPYVRHHERPSLRAETARVQRAMATAGSLCDVVDQVGLPLNRVAYIVRRLDPGWVARQRAHRVARRHQARRALLERLRMALAYRQRTMADVARIAGIRRAQVSQILVNGVRPDELPALSCVLDVPLPWLADGVGKAPQGCTPSCLQAWGRSGIQRMPTALRERRQRVDAALLRRQPQGWTYTRIAKHIGCDVRYVRHCARRLRGADH